MFTGLFIFNKIAKYSTTQLWRRRLVCALNEPVTILEDLNILSYLSASFYPGSAAYKSPLK